MRAKVVVRSSFVMCFRSTSYAASFISAERYHFTDKGGGVLTFDPRFLVFEIAHNMVLRESQVRLVTKFHDAYRGKLFAQREEEAAMAVTEALGAAGRGRMPR